MELRLLDWRRTAAITLLMASAGSLSLHAQESQPAPGSKFRVLVPNLERREASAKKDFGEDVAEHVRKQLASMPRHAPIEKKEMQNELRTLKLKEEEMGCVENRQLGIRMNAELVMCGEYWPAATGHRAYVQFISPKTGQAFVVDTFPAATPQEAASHVFANFQRFITHLEFAAFCNDYLASTQWQDAISNCEKALEIDPNSPPALKGKAMALYQLGVANVESPDMNRLNQALELYRKVLQLNPIDQDALRQAGIVSARVGQNEASREFFRQYLEMNPGDVAVRLNIANEQAKAGDPEGASRVVAEGLKTDSANLDLLTFAGVFAAQAAFKVQSEKGTSPSELVPEAKVLYETAYGFYDRLFKVKNGDVEMPIITQMMGTLVSLGRHQEAVDFGRQVTAGKAANNGQIWLMYANALDALGRTDEAIAAYDAAIARNDTSATGIRYRKAIALLKTKDLQRIVPALRDAVSANEVDAKDASDLIFATAYNDHFKAERWDTAIEWFNAAREIAVTPEQKGKLAFWIGTVHYQRGSALKPENAAGARNALPHFTRALSFYEEAAPYGRANPDSNWAATIENVRKYIEYLNALIKRGV